MTNECERHEYVLGQYVLIHYLGDLSLADGHAHGNAIHKQTPHVRSSAHVKQNITSSKGGPAKTFKTLNSKDPGGIESMIHLPKSMQQIRDFQFQHRKEQSLGNDEVQITSHIAQVIPKFVQKNKKKYAFVMPKNNKKTFEGYKGYINNIIKANKKLEDHINTENN